MKVQELYGDTEIARAEVMHDAPGDEGLEHAALRGGEAAVAHQTPIVAR